MNNRPPCCRVQAHVHRRRASHAAAVVALLLTLAPGAARHAAGAATAPESTADVFGVSLEDLLSMEVTSPSRFHQPLMESHNAV